MLNGKAHETGEAAYRFAELQEGSLKENKKELRKHILLLLEEMNDDARGRKTALINDAVIEQFLRPVDSASQRAFTLFTYLPFRQEVNLLPLIQYGWQQGYRVVVPKVIPKGRKISLHVIHSLEDVESGHGGILEPRLGIPEFTELGQIDTMLVPGLAFDRSGARLGYGGGYYDRFMSRLRQLSLSRPMKLALAFDLQIVSSVPTEDHDLRVDQVITESGCLMK